MHKMHLSADSLASRTARMLLTVSRLDHLIRYGMILIHLALSGGEGIHVQSPLRPSGSMSSLTASLDRMLMPAAA